MVLIAVLTLCQMKIQRLLKERFPEVPPNPTRVPMAQRARDEITRGPRGAPEPDGPRWRDRERTRRDPRSVITGERSNLDSNSLHGIGTWCMCGST